MLTRGSFFLSLCVCLVFHCLFIGRVLVLARSMTWPSRSLVRVCWVCPQESQPSCACNVALTGVGALAAGYGHWRRSSICWSMGLIRSPKTKMGKQTSLPDMGCAQRTAVCSWSCEAWVRPASPTHAHDKILEKPPTGYVSLALSRAIPTW